MSMGYITLYWVWEIKDNKSNVPHPSTKPNLLCSISLNNKVLGQVRISWIRTKEI